MEIHAVTDAITIDKYKANIYTLNTEVLKDEANFFNNYERLSSARQNKINSYRFAADQRLSLGVGMLLDRGLTTYGLREKDVQIAYGKHGKPYLANYPQIHFNLAHSGQMALAVFADVETGCDIEPVREADFVLAKRFFCAGEYAYVAKQVEIETAGDAFYRLWTLKESFLKAVGLGLSLPLDAFEIQFGADETVQIRQSVNQSSYRFWEYLFGTYRAAVCFCEKDLN